MPVGLPGGSGKIHMTTTHMILVKRRLKLNIHITANGAMKMQCEKCYKQ
jgi:hypothetical protein